MIYNYKLLIEIKNRKLLLENETIFHLRYHLTIEARIILFIMVYIFEYAIEYAI